jgi:DNA-directed RNA polymerase specialized sigma24 family protein
MERFAFVMSFCEGYSDHDCALLLGCMRADVAAARVRALQRIGKPEQIHNRIATEPVLQHTPDLSGVVAVPA